jgi:glycerol-3-phosphate dehydrogenase (NAD(P)+)
MASFENIGVIGAGAWGTALANAAARAGRRVTLWGRNAQAMTAMRDSRESAHLPGLKLADSITVTADLAHATRADALLLVVPAQSVRATAAMIAPLTSATTPLILCAKGIERGSRKFMSEVAQEAAPHMRVAVLSGPSFAEDVARGLPTAVALAAHDETLAMDLAHALGSLTFRPYHSTDVRGAEIGGAAKNVLAIAAGIVAGRALGASAQAALVTRGFAELVRFGRAFGAQLETLSGLSGLGDLILTCSSPQSRNYSFGLALGRGEAAHGKLTEGQFTAVVIAELAEAHGIDMPIASAVHAILDNAITIDAAIAALLARPFKGES